MFKFCCTKFLFIYIHTHTSLSKFCLIILSYCSLIYTRRILRGSLLNPLAKIKPNDQTIVFISGQSDNFQHPLILLHVNITILSLEDTLLHECTHSKTLIFIHPHECMSTCTVTYLPSFMYMYTHL